MAWESWHRSPGKMHVGVVHGARGKAAPGPRRPQGSLPSSCLGLGQRHVVTCLCTYSGLSAYVRGRLFLQVFVHLCARGHGRQSLHLSPCLSHT